MRINAIDNNALIAALLGPGTVSRGRLRPVDVARGEDAPPAYGASPAVSDEDVVDIRGVRAPDRIPTSPSNSVRSATTPGAIPSPEQALNKPDGEQSDDADARADAGESKGVDGKPLSDEEESQIRELKQRDAEVRRHEQAHKAAAGAHASGGPHYEYQTGPDGKQYAVGGHVTIDMSPVANDPQATIQKMQQIQRAATAPAEPSSQDRAVAAQARATEQQARQELAEKRRSESQDSEDSGQEDSGQAASEPGRAAISGQATNSGQAASEPGRAAIPGQATNSGQATFEPGRAAISGQATNSGQAASEPGRAAISGQATIAEGIGQFISAGSASARRALDEIGRDRASPIENASGSATGTGQAREGIASHFAQESGNIAFEHSAGRPSEPAYSAVSESVNQVGHAQHAALVRAYASPRPSPRASVLNLVA